MDIAYQKLSELIREYLGLTETAAKTLAPTAGTNLSPLYQVDFPWKIRQPCSSWLLISWANAGSQYLIPTIFSPGIYESAPLCLLMMLDRGGAGEGLALPLTWPSCLAVLGFGFLS